jgi:hypothetical protein
LNSDDCGFCDTEEYDLTNGTAEVLNTGEFDIIVYSYFLDIVMSVGVISDVADSLSIMVVDCCGIFRIVGVEGAMVGTAEVKPTQT